MEHKFKPKKVLLQIGITEDDCLTHVSNKLSGIEVMALTGYLDLLSKSFKDDNNFNYEDKE